MRGNLLLLLCITFQTAVAQDAYYSVKGTRYPIWYSKTKVLVRFKSISAAEQFKQESISSEVTRVEVIHSIPDMAYLIFDSSISKSGHDSAIVKLQGSEHVKSAHSMLVTESGEEVAGLSDQMIARPKIDVSEEQALRAFRLLNLGVEAEDTDSRQNFYLTGKLVSSNPFAACEKLEETGLFEFVHRNYLCQTNHSKCLCPSHHQTINLGRQSKYH